MLHFVTSFCDKFLKAANMAMAWKFSWFLLVIVIVYIFMGLVLQVVDPFIPVGNKSSKKLKGAGLFKNV